VIKKCPQCGKEFDVLWPHLWSYKRSQEFLCTYTCLKAYDEGKEANEMGKITNAQKEKAINIAVEGGDPRPYLKQCGSIAPDKMWGYIKMQLKKKEPETYEKLAKVGQKDPPKVEEVPAITEEDIKAINEQIRKNKAVKPIYYEGYTVRCIEGVMGRFFYDSQYDRLDWTTPEGDEVSFSPEAWKRFATEELPKVMALLGVKL
jgi:hypothetical protein